MGLSCRELRLGNYIHYRNSEPFQITEEVLMDHHFWEDLDIIMPVDLNSEILQLAAFDVEKKEGNNCVFYVYTKEPLTFNTLHGWWLFNHQLKVYPKYVHQLQNLFLSLTGKELEIKL